MNKKNIVWVVVAVVVLLGGMLTLFYKEKKQEEMINEVGEFFTDTTALKVDASLYDQQKMVDAEIKGYQKDNSITLDNAKVMVNPYFISPLTALIVFNTTNKVSVTLEINNEEKITFAEATQHTIPIYGLMGNYENKIKITTSDNKSKTFTIKTEAVPKEIRPMIVNMADKTKLTNDLYLFTSPQIVGPFAYDKDGKVKWYLTENFHVAPIVMDNGHLLLGNSVMRDAFSSQTGFVEIDLLGKVYNEYVSNEGYHHDIVFKDNNFIFIGNNANRSSFLDFIVEMDRNGKVVKKWDISEIVGKVDSNFTKELTNVWAWINSVYYDKASNSLIISLRGRNSVISVDYTSSKLNWIFGDKKFWSDKFASYILETDSNTSVPLGQHSAFITSDGYLGLFNNNYDASDYAYSAPCSELVGKYSSAVLYRINDKKITTVMEYNDDQKLYSFALSNFKTLANNNRLILSGWEFKPEVFSNPACDSFSNMELKSRVLELDANNNVLFDATFEEGAYRVEKLSLYNDNTKKIDIISYKKLGTIDNQTLKEVSLSNRLDKLKNAETIIFEHNSDSGRMSISAYFPHDAEIKILFVSENGKGYELLVKGKDEIDARYVYTDKLKGKYHIYLIWDNDYFDTETILEY